MNPTPSCKANDRLCVVVGVARCDGQHQTIRKGLGLESVSEMSQVVGHSRLAPTGIAISLLRHHIGLWLLKDAHPTEVMTGLGNHYK